MQHPILLADDERENLDLMERILRSRYGPFYIAHDGQEGLQILEQHKVDLVLADHRMPKLKGTELLKHSCNLQPDAGRILVTGYGDLETLTSAVNDGHAFHVVSKPIHRAVLEAVVEQALEHREAQLRERLLFDAFVYASVNAIEQRDPSTAGHSFRVAKMTMGLAMVVDGVSEGRFADVRFSRDAIEQIKYASLLHDFGKIGVREAVLLKSHKLPPARWQLFEQRVRLAMRYERIDRGEGERLLAEMQRLNNPEFDPNVDPGAIDALGASPLVDTDDLAYLRIDHGSLSPTERLEIETHVTGTVTFLKQIPWPARLGRVAEIAGAHHETLNGAGYPAGIRDVPLESRMMTVCDIYDALVAADRPYKTAVPHQRAIEILTRMSQQGALDPGLLELFVARKVHRGARAETARH